ncbi:hypothetical protein BGS_0776 [Beggiatoa sp. SS]|nr:hypothetical protein BGS_0776 [Beggiatoa sp. SS]
MISPKPGLQKSPKTPPYFFSQLSEKQPPRTFIDSPV